MKVEFGIASDGSLLLADVIDNDSSRVIEDGAYIDKQLYRDGGDLSDVARKYQLVEQLTARFTLPRQRIIVWAGLPKDESGAIAVKKFSRGQLPATTIACSVHKEPVRGVLELTRLLQEVPDSVVIAVIGMSNGAGPTLPGQYHGPGDHRSGRLREVPRGCMVVAAGSEQCPGNDGA